MELPPGPEQLFEEAERRLSRVQRLVDCAKASWGALTKAQQREMEEVVSNFRIAAEQWHFSAQFSLGGRYETGQGVKKYHAEAVRWWRKAAEQRYAAAQFNLGLVYSKGQG